MPNSILHLLNYLCQKPIFFYLDSVTYLCNRTIRFSSINCSVQCTQAPVVFQYIWRYKSRREILSIFLRQRLQNLTKLYQFLTKICKFLAMERKKLTIFLTGTSRREKNWFFDPRNPRQVPNCLTLSCQMVSREIKRRSYKGAPIRLLPPLACSCLLVSHSVSFIPWSPCRDLAHVYKGHHYFSIYQLPWWAGPGCSGL